MEADPEVNPYTQPNYHRIAVLEGELESLRDEQRRLERQMRERQNESTNLLVTIIEAKQNAFNWMKWQEDHGYCPF